MYLGYLNKYICNRFPLALEDFDYENAVHKAALKGIPLAYSLLVLLYVGKMGTEHRTIIIFGCISRKLIGLEFQSFEPYVYYEEVRIFTNCLIVRARKN